MKIKEIIQRLQVAMDDAKGQESHFESWLIQNEAICDAIDALKEKEWVGLTDDDVNYSVDVIYKGFDVKPRNEIEIKYFERVIKFVEAKLKEKNT